MNFMITYEKLSGSDKDDIEFLKNCHKIREIEKFIKISDVFFDYVTSTPNIYYYKIIINNKIVGGLHLQVKNQILYCSIWILPDFQKKGVAGCVINDLKSDCFKLNYNEIQAGINKNNINSLSLFKKLDFEETKVEDGIVDVKYVIKH